MCCKDEIQQVYMFWYKKLIEKKKFQKILNILPDMANFIKVAKFFKALSDNFHNSIFENKHFVCNKKDLCNKKFKKNFELMRLTGKK